MQLALPLAPHRALCRRAQLYKWGGGAEVTSAVSGIKYQVSRIPLHTQDPILNGKEVGARVLTVPGTALIFSTFTFTNSLKARCMVDLEKGLLPAS